MKKINITVTGGLGRMGKIIIKKIINSNQFNLSSVTEKITNKTINKIKFKTNSISSIKDCDVIIDFSNVVRLLYHGPAFFEILRIPSDF